VLCKFWGLDIVSHSSFIMCDGKFKCRVVLLTLCMIDPSICMVFIHRPQSFISCKVIDICVKFSSFPAILIIAGVLPIQSPALNSITT